MILYNMTPLNNCSRQIVCVGKQTRKNMLDYRIILYSAVLSQMKKFSNCLYFLSLWLFLGPKMTIVSPLTWIQLNN